MRSFILFLFDFFRLFFSSFQIEIIRNEGDLVKVMRKLSAERNSADFLKGLKTLIHLQPSPKTRHFNELLSDTKSLVNPIEQKTQSLIAQGQEMIKRRSSANVAGALQENSAQNTSFRKGIDALMKNLRQTTSQVGKNVQKRKAIAVRNQLQKKRAGQNYQREEQAISIYEAFQNVLDRLSRVPGDICREILGSARCQLEEGGSNQTSPPPSTTTPITEVITEEETSEDSSEGYWLSE